MNTGNLTSAVAIIVSLGTLLVFVYQTNLIRKQQYMSVYPYLDLGNYNSGTKSYRYVLKNNGIGPAILKSVRIQRGNGKAYQDLIDYVEAEGPNWDSAPYYHANLSLGRLIPANEEVSIIGAWEDIDSTGLRALYQSLNYEDLLIEIEYESIYEERWKASNQSGIPEKIN